jgi:hypothetical protein
LLRPFPEGLSSGGGGKISCGVLSYNV